MKSNWSYSPETLNSGQNRQFFVPCYLKIWQMTLKNKRAALLSNIKLYASFHHMWIQTRVTVRKRLNGVMTSVTLTFDRWPWPFAWTLRLSLVITPENFMIIRLWNHSEKGVKDRRTDGRANRQTERSVVRAAWSQLKWITVSMGMPCLLRVFNKSRHSHGFQSYFSDHLCSLQKPSQKWNVPLYTMGAPCNLICNGHTC